MATTENITKIHNFLSTTRKGKHFTVEMNDGRVPVEGVFKKATQKQHITEITFVDKKGKEKVANLLIPIDDVIIEGNRISIPYTITFTGELNGLEKTFNELREEPAENTLQNLYNKTITITFL